MIIKALFILLLQFCLCANGFHLIVGSKRSVATVRHLSEAPDILESSHPNIEKAWRYVKKPLLRLGSKGASKSHGNSLKELLQAHTAVKVKINAKKVDYDESFAALVKLALEAGAPEGIECLQYRDIEKTILFGLPGTLEKIQAGDFPPPPPPPPPQEEEEE
eukprot:CAMPEP_0194218818 /NCGR_PEP_ID=MMETSP0156-20130528/24577_1 /TAXON_ID=33649 /ORGANISM="Thalassionema nitzschioides, Strain L26-B" /LENGTH=161 /DNA_ID=CAMNT_0038948291 /DNA_START=53 /DNA_END=535 /DNA_ORIENTATION=+